MLSHYFIEAIILKTYPVSAPKGSAKLEKAEILQMTVDHLKMLQATGGKGKTACYWFPSCSPPKAVVKFEHGVPF